MLDQTNNKNNHKNNIFKDSYQESISQNLTKNTTQSASHQNNSVVSEDNDGVNEILSNKLNIDEEKRKSENINKNKLPNINEFTLFNNDEENEILKLGDDKIIYKYLIKKYKSKENEIEIIKDLYPKEEIANSELKATEFLSMGVFEDLSYYPLWTSDNLLNKLINELKNKTNIKYWRRIKGDGNCYYRSIIFNYLELLILLSIEKNDPSIFFCLIKEICSTKFPCNLVKLHSKLLTVLLIIYEKISKDPSFAFNFLYRSINKGKLIGKSFIYWFRLKLSNFLKENINLEINGLKLIESIPEIDHDDSLMSIEPDDDQLNNYIDQKILQMDEFVDGYPIYITPFIIKCPLNIYSLNKTKDKKVKNKINLSMNKETFDIPQNVMFVPVDSYLPFLDSGECINILFRSPHYDSLGDQNYVQRISKIFENHYFILNEDLLDENEYEIYKATIIKSWEKKNNNKISRIERKKKKSQTQNTKQKEKKETKTNTLIKNNHYSLGRITPAKKINSEIKTEKEIQKDAENEKNRNTRKTNTLNNKNICVQYSESKIKCNKCSEDMTHRLPCGCLICIKCSKNSINNFIKSKDANKKNNNISLSICNCGYNLNEKDQEIILNN